MAAELFADLCETTVAGSAAILLVLLLRRPLRRAFGAGIAHAAWALVPLAMVAVLLPSARVPLPVAMPAITVLVPVDSTMATAASRTFVAPHAWLVAGWACGALACALWMAMQQRRFLRGLGRLSDRGDGVLVADAVAGLPAVTGLWRPSIVLPADALHRYDDGERALMLEHERTHIARGDLLANAVVALLRCLYWFNPLVHLAASRFRHDQELACDQQVVRRHPDARRAYGEAMLKTQLAGGVLPFGCHWGQTHPLRERIEMLKQPLHTPRRRALGAAVALVLSLATGYAAWAAQPADLKATSALPAAALRQAAAATQAEPQATVAERAAPPVYPVDVMKKGLNGTVVMLVDVAADGSVSGARVERSSGEQRLDAAALGTVVKWKFTPAIKEGKPVAGQVRVPVEFKLDAKGDAQASAAPHGLRASPSAGYDQWLHSLAASWQPPAPVPATDDC